MRLYYSDSFMAMGDTEDFEQAAISTARDSVFTYLNRTRTPIAVLKDHHVLYKNRQVERP